MTPTEAFPISILLLAIIPAFVLIIGTILFLIKPKHAKIIGCILAPLGAIETITWFSITKDSTAIVNLIYLLTLTIGVSSLTYAYRPNKKWFKCLVKNVKSLI